MMSEELVVCWLTATDGTLIRLRDIVTMKPLAVEAMSGENKVWLARVEVHVVTGRSFQCEVSQSNPFDQQKPCLEYARNVLIEKIFEFIGED